MKLSYFQRNFAFIPPIGDGTNMRWERKLYFIGFGAESKVS